jgi:hypothetical protein
MRILDGDVRPDRKNHASDLGLWSGKMGGNTQPCTTMSVRILFAKVLSRNGQSHDKLPRNYIMTNLSAR